MASGVSGPLTNGTLLIVIFWPGRGLSELLEPSTLLQARYLWPELGWGDSITLAVFPLLEK